MSFEATQVIQRELRSGERLLWSAQPAQGIRFRRTDVALIPFSLLWTSFAVFWVWSAFTEGAPISFLLFGTAFVLVGLHFVAGRFVADAYGRRHTYYGLTNERLLIVRAGVGTDVIDLDVPRIAGMSLREDGSGRGTIMLGAESQPFAGIYASLAESGWPGMARYAPPMFEMIHDARRVHESIRAAQREATRVEQSGT